MRGFLSLEPDAVTLAKLITSQNRLRDGLTRQGVSFPERLGATLIAWPFGTLEEIERAAEALGSIRLPPLPLGSLGGRPNDDRPAEVGFALDGIEALQARFFEALRAPLDPDPPKPAFVRLARVSPPSRKVGAALRGARTGAAPETFFPSGVAFWRQTPQGFELCRTMPLEHG